MSKSKPKDMSAFDHAIVEDNGEDTIKSECNRFDCDEAIRLNESQVRALLDYDRAVAIGWRGKKVIVEMYPDTENNQPVEIREADADRTVPREDQS